MQKADELARVKGLRVTYVDSVHAPLAVVKVSGVRALGELRRLPSSSYVEPASAPVQSFSSCGVGDPLSSSSLLSLTLGSGADKYSRSFRTFWGMNIANAWRMTTGTGVVVGVTDTGLDQSPASEFAPGRFAAGASAGRALTVDKTVSNNFPFPTCAHGTRSAGIIGAPRDGSGVVGVAYGASMAFVWGNDNVLINTFGGTWEMRQALVMAASVRHAKVINMAWGLTRFSQAISDEIDRGYYGLGIVYVGAAGTCYDGPPAQVCPYGSTPVWPAAQAEVLAVSGMLEDGSFPTNVYGLGSNPWKIRAVVGSATRTLGSTSIVGLEGSSGATAVVSGVVALMRARFQYLSAAQIVNRLIASKGCNGLQNAEGTGFDAGAANGGPCIVRWRSMQPVTYYTDDQPYGEGYILSNVVANHLNALPSANTGSGNYSVNWSTRVGGTVMQGLGGTSYVDADGAKVFVNRVSFARSVDGAPYKDSVTFQLHDNALGTDDIVTRPVLVCSLPSNCWDTDRAYPGPPPVSQVSITIAGPTFVSEAGSHSWYATAVNAPPASTIGWDVSSDGGQSWSISATGPTYARWVEPYYSGTLLVRARIVEGGVSVATSMLSVSINTNTGCIDPSSCYAFRVGRGTSALWPSVPQSRRVAKRFVATR
ncbi:MAG: S8/S53 family peptidase [Gemmatimonadaceae bacterium]|nr:S8/S53 family peptidase [Gemmatimonadaceae bacterium]